MMAWLASGLTLATLGTAQSSGGSNLDYQFTIQAGALDFAECVSTSVDLDGDGSFEVLIANDGNWGGPYEVRIHSLSDGQFIRAVSGPHAHWGHAVEAIGDMDGDGLPDYLVGAPQANGNRGLAEIRSGVSDALIRTHLAAGTAYDDRFGNSVGSLGDIDGDGIGDYFITASSEDPVSSSAHYVGSIRHYSGATGTAISLVMGNGGGHYAGNASHGRDLDGDGGLEVVNSSNAGYLRLHDDLGGVIREYNHGLGARGFGRLTSDHDDDGAPDLAVWGEGGGRIDIVSTSTWNTIVTIPGNASMPLTSSFGEGPGNMDLVPDLDGDGYEDIAYGEHDLGLVFLISARTGALIETIPSPNGPGGPFGFVVRHLPATNQLLIAELSEALHVYSLTDPDCNGNGTPDDQDILDGTSNDCDGDGVPDECQIADDPALDCDGNGLLDSCELIIDPNLDCDGDSVLDSCQITNDGALDCDGNGILDSCELLADPELDCDGDNVLDACQIADDPSLDQNDNGILDSCECGFETYCEASWNSTGGPAQIGASGSPSLAANDLTLTVSSLPPGQFGLFFYGAEQDFFLVGFGAVCVQAPLVRVHPVTLSDAAGTTSLTLDLSDHPFAYGKGQVAAFETWHFQYWYRDPANHPADFNFSNGLSVTFCP